MLLLLFILFFFFQIEQSNISCNVNTHFADLFDDLYELIAVFVETVDVSVGRRGLYERHEVVSRPYY